MSSWKTSARRGTMNEMGSMYASFTVLKARMTSLSWVLIPRLGMKATPLWGSADLYSERNSNLSCAYSKYRMLPSLSGVNQRFLYTRLISPFSSKVKTLGTVIPKRHAHSR